MGRLSILFAEMRSIKILEKFFTCLKFIYINSKPPIKLIQKVSTIIDVTIGTEQGHPLSPELFKMFVHDLSIKLAEMDYHTSVRVPLLDDFPVYHLLWADDLILLVLALNDRSLQAQ